MYLSFMLSVFEINDNVKGNRQKKENKSGDNMVLTTNDRFVEIVEIF